MRELASRLEHIGWINRDMDLAAAMTVPHCARLLELRADFNYECNTLFNDLTGKLASHEHAQMASRLLDTYLDMRSKIIAHQQRWPAHEIGRDPEQYIASGRKTYAVIVDFVERGLEIVRSASSALQQPSEGIVQHPQIRLTGTR